MFQAREVIKVANLKPESTEEIDVHCISYRGNLKFKILYEISSRGNMNAKFSGASER